MHAPPMTIRVTPDLLRLPCFLVPFAGVAATVLVGFGVVRGMCRHGVPDNCNLAESTHVIEQLIACLERCFLILAIGNLAFVTVRRARWRYALVLHACALVSCVAVSGALHDADIRAGGANGKCIAVALVLATGLLVPLTYTLVAQNTRGQRWKSLAVVLAYGAFLIATAGVGGLHIHHWSWSFIYLLVAQPTTHLHTHARMHCALVVWSHVACMVALGVLIQGFAAYSSLFFFISTTVPCDASTAP
jgi:hypothetical protein